MSALLWPPASRPLTPTPAWRSLPPANSAARLSGKLSDTLARPTAPRICKWKINCLLGFCAQHSTKEGVPDPLLPSPSPPRTQTPRFRSTHSHVHLPGLVLEAAVRQLRLTRRVTPKGWSAAPAKHAARERAADTQIQEAHPEQVPWKVRVRPHGLGADPAGGEWLPGKGPEGGPTLTPDGAGDALCLVREAHTPACLGLVHFLFAQSPVKYFRACAGVTATQQIDHVPWEKGTCHRKRSPA